MILKESQVEPLEKLDAMLTKGAFRRGFRYYAYRDIRPRHRREISLRRAPAVLVKLLKERTLPVDAFIKPCEQPLFIGGVTGRSGTTWLKNVLRDQFSESHEVVGEIGFFDLSQFRNAPYEFYQISNFPSARSRYVSYFRDFVIERAYLLRRRMTGGMRGLCDLLPQRGVKMALDRLAENVEEARSLEEIQVAFGQFYLWLFNFHSAIVADGKPWISKEPPYGRHADQLFEMIPNAKLIVMTRDGRDSVLSMYRGNWHPTVKEAINRWYHFTSMTLDALKQCPPEQCLIVRYEDLATGFPKEMNRICDFFGLTEIDVPSIMQDPLLKPSASSIGRWKTEMTCEDQEYFAVKCSSLMDSLGYNI